MSDKMYAHVFLVSIAMSRYPPHHPNCAGVACGKPVSPQLPTEAETESARVALLEDVPTLQTF
jgi:hypothetical protein